jgi:shikimate dehydrogenase
MSSVPYAEVIGDPIAQSKSPTIHKFWLEKLGLPGDYRARRVAADDLFDFFEQRRREPDWRGCNVTIPHKLSALDLSDRRDDLADSIGASNCIVRGDDGLLTATNTDSDGFAEPIAGMDLCGREVAVIGAGGAARAVLMSLARREVGFVRIHARDRVRAGELLEHFGLPGEPVPFDAPLASATTLLVNSSPLGMIGQPALEIDLGPLGEGAVVYDLVYNPLETLLLAEARRRGLCAIDGLGMLIGQAAIAFAKFFASPAPREHDAELRKLLTS